MSKWKYYVMPMFPYPSGDSMHVGHASNYIINDFVARYKKMQGYDVIHAMWFDSFGLPTENYAIKTGKSARQATKDNILNFKEQIKAINLEFDPEREFATSDPEYYKWTQWIFAKLFEHGLAYKKDGLVNRCNGCQTVLANDQVVEGKCERCETIIIQKKHPQRYIKTTALANELIDDLDTIDRPEETKTIQRNWIGRSFGTEIDFKINSQSSTLNSQFWDNPEAIIENWEFLHWELGKYIICDFDGVIGDSFETIAKGMENMGSFMWKTFSYKDAREFTAHYARSKPNHAKDTKLSNEELLTQKLQVKELGKLVHDLGFGLHREFIDTLKTMQNIHIAIVSSGSEEYVQPAIIESWLEPTHILCYEDHHSKEEKIELICKDWWVSKDKVYYVTDSLADVYELKDYISEDKIIWVTRGQCNRKELEIELKSEYIIDNQNDIGSIDLYKTAVGRDALVARPQNKIITVFTTRPDTLYGVTALVLAPENQIIDYLLSEEKKKELEAFRAEVAKLTSIDRQSTEREKNGINSGIFVTHPLTGEQVPIWFADYVLMDYATGAVMMVPAHDERDREFAKRFEIEVKWVISSESTFSDGLIKSTFSDGLSSPPTPLLQRGETKDHIYDGQDKWLVEFAKWLRKDWTQGEKIVWEALRDRKYNNFKFRRQHPIWWYIADFYCDELKLIIEVDGSIHDDKNQIIKDRFRNEDLSLKWLSIIRIANNEVLENPNTIYEKLNTHCSSPSLKERGLGGEDKPQKDNSLSRDESYTEPGYLINSAQFDWLDNISAKTKITEHLEQLGVGRKKTTFRLRDRSVSRQRYRWSPIPVYYTFEDNQKVAYFEWTWDRAPRLNEKIETRKVCSAIIKHHSDDKYLFLKWNNSFGLCFATGGIDDWESLIESWIREAQEETGYKNFTYITTLDAESHSSFYAIHKNIWRYMVQNTIVLQLTNDETEEKVKEDHDDFELIRLTKEEVEKENIVWNNRYAWDAYINGEQPKSDHYINRYNAYNPHPDKSKWIPHLIPDDELPVILPLDLPNYKPAGKSPLEDHPTFKYYKPENKKIPYYKYETWDRKFREWKSVTHRKTIIAMIKNPETEEFLMLKRKWLSTVSCVLWWVEDWESSLSTCFREIAEETWYKNPKFIKKIWGEFHSLFWHANKQINQYNVAECYYFEIDTKDQGDISNEEKSKHEVVRIPKESVKQIWNDPINSYYFDILFWNDAIAPSYIDQYNGYNPQPIYLRECDTLDTFMCSSFYFLRYLDPSNTNQFISDKAAKNMPVDLYIGWKEHTVWHLIYSRFIYKFLQKNGYIKNDSTEPFQKLIHQGMVHATDGRKFSKRRGNGINPIDVVNQHNTDTLRTYLAFMGPIELPKNWNPEGVAGVGRFLKRFEKLTEFASSPPSPSEWSEAEWAVGRGSGWGAISIIHQTIKWVTEDMDNLKFNTAISKLMIATNAIYEGGWIDNSSLQNLIILAYPFAPETAQRMWSAIGGTSEVKKESWPSYDSQLINNSTIELPIQINGKTKWSLSVAKDINQDEVLVLVRQDEKLKRFVEWEIKKIIRVPGRICNIIV